MMLRMFSALILSLVLGLASVTMAVARAQTVGADQITICSGYGIVSIAVDSQGNPVGPVHPCPDCLAGLALGPLPEPAAVIRPASTGYLIRLPVTLQHKAQARTRPQARGPPLSI